MNKLPRFTQLAVQLFSILFFLNIQHSAQGAEGLGFAPQNPEIAIKGNAGVFIGINSFEFSKAMSLNYAVNDAIAMAHAFVFDLRLIPAMNCWLLIDGEPTGESAVAQLKALKDAGVEPTKGTKTKLIIGLKQAADVAKADSDLLVYYVSSHGFEEEGVPYVLGADSYPTLLKDTGLKVSVFDELFKRSTAKKKILFIDACRETSGGTKGGGQSAAALFSQSFDDAQGQATLMSCDSGQKSYEAEEHKLGIFTHYVVKNLKEGNEGDSRGLVTLGSLSEYVAREVHNWAKRNRSSSAEKELQSPFIKGPVLARNIPFRLSIKGSEIQVRRKDGLKHLTSSVLAQNQPLPSQLLDEVRNALDTYTGAQLDEILSQLQLLATDTPPARTNFRRFWKDFSQSMQPLLVKTPLKGKRAKEGQKISLTAEVEGPSGKEFIWEYQRFDQGTWQRLDAPNQSELIISNALASNSGRYKLTVLAGDQKLVIGPVELTVLSKPKIITNPEALTLTEGEKGTLSVGAVGDNIEYAWEFKPFGKSSWKPLEAVSSSYTIPKALVSLAGDYRVTVRNESGSAMSSTAKVTISELIKPPVFFIQPLDQETTEFSDVTFTCEAEGSEPINYEWEKLSENDSLWRPIGKKTRQLVLQKIAKSDAGRYRAKVTNVGGEMVSKSASLSVRSAATKFTMFINPSVIHTVEGASIYAEGAGFFVKTLVAMKLPSTFNSSYSWQIQWLPQFGGGFSQVKVNGDIVNVFPNGFGGYFERPTGRLIP